MASKVDMSLDDIVTLNKKKGGNKGGGGGKPFQGKPKFTGGKPQAQSGIQTKTADLRKVISNKQKSSITDLRTKIKPKALYTSKFVEKHTSKSNPSTPKGVQGRIGKARPKYSSEDIPETRSRRSDPGPLLSRGTFKLPSYEDAKKITVTVPGSVRPTTSVEVSWLVCFAPLGQLLLWYVDDVIRLLIL